MTKNDSNIAQLKQYLHRKSNDLDLYLKALNSAYSIHNMTTLLFIATKRSKQLVAIRTMRLLAIIAVFYKGKIVLSLNANC